MGKKTKFSKDNKVILALAVVGAVIALAAATQNGSLAGLLVIIGFAAFLLGLVLALLRFLGIF